MGCDTLSILHKSLHNCSDSIAWHNRTLADMVLHELNNRGVLDRVYHRFLIQNRPGVAAQMTHPESEQPSVCAHFSRAIMVI